MRNRFTLLPGSVIRLANLHLRAKTNVTLRAWAAREKRGTCTWNTCYEEDAPPALMKGKSFAEGFPPEDLHPCARLTWVTRRRFAACGGSVSSSPSTLFISKDSGNNVSTLAPFRVENDKYFAKGFVGYGMTLLGMIQGESTRYASLRIIRALKVGLYTFVSFLADVSFFFVTVLCTL